jgi:CheY-like chemotaxis protein
MPLEGLHVMVVEDESPVAMVVEAMLEDLGCVVEASAWRVPQALELAQSRPLDLAVLDVNVAGEEVFPVASVLRERGVPFVFATGYGVDGVPVGFRDAPIIAKPFQSPDLEQAIGRALADPPHPDPDLKSGGL